MNETITGRYNFEARAQEAALELTVQTGITHYYRRDPLTDTFVVYIIA